MSKRKVETFIVDGKRIQDFSEEDDHGNVIHSIYTNGAFKEKSSSSYRDSYNPTPRKYFDGDLPDEKTAKMFLREDTFIYVFSVIICIFATIGFFWCCYALLVWFCNR